jgi:tRNA pseudouridine55 synthase
MIVKEKRPALDTSRSTDTDPVSRGTYQKRAMGILIVNKPSGPTSRDMVDQVARLFPHTKVGHAGTLDPRASGILVICVGAATRLVEALQRLSKSYRTVVRLGARSDTLDADGRIVEESSPRVPSASEIELVVQANRGVVVQQPPEFSALKVKGRRAYDLARAGQLVELAARPVRIDRIAVVRYHWPNLELEIDCGSGTFIRSIARDIGEALACGGLVETLTRTRIGPFTLDAAVEPAHLAGLLIDRQLRPALDAVPDLPRIVLDTPQLEAVVHGRRLSAAELGDPTVRAKELALLDRAGNLVALARFDHPDGWLQPTKVLI